MPIDNDELKLYRSALISLTPAVNGGVMSLNEAVSGVNNNIFPDAASPERLAGSVVYRKVFFANTNSSDLPLLNHRVFMDKYTQGDDEVYFFEGTYTDLESAVSPTPKLYGAGKLDSNVSSAATSIDVLIESPARQFFLDGDVIRISDKVDVNSAGQEEFVTISGTPSIAGSVVTITLATPLVNGYAASNTRVSLSLDGVADLAPSITGTSVTSVGSGDVDFGDVSVSNLGTIYDTWTLSFTSSSAFTVSGALTGAIGSGNTVSTFAYNNPNTATPYFTLPSSAFSGAWTSGDSVTFTTIPASIPLWCVRIIPAATVSLSGNKFTLAIEGETA